ncbi:integrase [Rhodanobacter sp. ANJX3]|uniref:hypothetical protein n=1 Tax=Rhodanobacter sp. ANJX3 TaxID=2723083 RepID=UPI00161BFC66|nr:hypothetical protein [Rhodanobacter sp. ANJX3]MBB5358620.1 integrase [Rhodanobacter sp. ANJX3]
MSKIDSFLVQDLERLRADARSAFSVSEIQNFKRVDLLALQSRLGHGSTWGKWRTPEEWLPKSLSAGAYLIEWELDTAFADRAWTEVLRYALLRSLVKKGRAIAKPITVMSEVRLLRRLAPALTIASHGTNRWWSSLTVDEMLEHMGNRGAAQVLCAFLGFLYRRKLIAEEPRQALRDDGAIERVRKGEQLKQSHISTRMGYQPFPDEFTGQCGQRVLWLIKTLGPTLLDCLEACLDARPPPPSRNHYAALVKGSRTAQNEAMETNRVRRTIVKEWEWRDPTGRRIERIPFGVFSARSIYSRRQLNLKLRDNEDPNSLPETWQAMRSFLTLLEAAHAWLLLLASGPRASTALSQKEDCLEAVGDGYRLKGIVTKNDRSVAGYSRDWPAPPIIEFTARQQIRLARLLKRMEPLSASENTGDHLWVTTLKSPVGGRLHDMNALLNKLVKNLGLKHLLAEEHQSAHVHRFRKTLARVIALTLTNAQMVAMDCFGHDDPDVTLKHYIMSDRAIIADVQQVQRELVILMAVDAINQSETLGGRVSTKIREAKAQFQRLHRKSKLDPEDVYELAEVLTLEGREWAIVMPGVICALPNLATGPCGTRQGRRNPGNCQSGCAHQLLTAYNKSECDDTVSYILEQIQKSEDLHSVSLNMWAGQLRNWLYRWHDVYLKWSDHPLVQRYGNPDLEADGIFS